METEKKHNQKTEEYFVKPKGLFHIFWHATDQKIRFIEIITPGDFEYYFAKLAPYLPDGQPPQMNKLLATVAKYGLIVDPTAADEIVTKYGSNPFG